MQIQIYQHNSLSLNKFLFQFLFSCSQLKKTTTYRENIQKTKTKQNKTNKTAFILTVAW